MQDRGSSSPTISSQSVSRISESVRSYFADPRFASPVRWIETQDVLFTHAKFERFIEVGPSPVLAGESTALSLANR